MAGDPDQYTDGFLGKPNAEYCQWIQDSQKWGGAIELAILSRSDYNVMPEALGLYQHRLQGQCRVCSISRLGLRNEECIIGGWSQPAMAFFDCKYDARYQAQAKLGGPACAVRQEQKGGNTDKKLLTLANSCPCVAPGAADSLQGRLLHTTSRQSAVTCMARTRTTLNGSCSSMMVFIMMPLPLQVITLIAQVAGCRRI